MQTDKKPTISFIIVNYNAREHLKKCIASLQDVAKKHAREVVIVNNDSSQLDYSKHTLQKDNVRVIEINKNIGYARASNKGAKEAHGEIICFLNPDTELLSQNLTAITEAFHDEDVGIAGPAIILSNGEAQPWSAGVPMTLLEVLRANIDLARSMHIWTSSKTQGVGWVSGAALFISKKLFTTLKGFDEKFFLYFEDVDLCTRARAQGEKIIRIPEVQVLHHGGVSSKNKKTQKAQYYTSQDYYFKKHFGTLHANTVRFLRWFHI